MNTHWPCLVLADQSSSLHEHRMAGRCVVGSRFFQETSQSSHPHEAPLLRQPHILAAIYPPQIFIFVNKISFKFVWSLEEFLEKIAPWVTLSEWDAISFGRSAVLNYLISNEPLSRKRRRYRQKFFNHRPHYIWSMKPFSLIYYACRKQISTALTIRPTLLDNQ